MNIPCGIVINRAGREQGEVEEYCSGEGIPILLTIPLDPDIARFYSQGLSLVEAQPWWKDNLIKLFDIIKEITDGHCG